MTGFESSSAVLKGAIPELRSLAAAALARAVGEPAELPAQSPHLAALLLAGRQNPPAVLRRGARMAQAMPFEEFAPRSPLQQRVLASGVRPGLPERVITRLRRQPVEVPPGSVVAVVRTALAAPAFLAQAQGIAYRGLRRRVFFAPGGPPSEPASVVTFLSLIIWSGRPAGLPPQAWARLAEVARQMADGPDRAGPTDRLLLAEAQKTFGRGGAQGGQGEKGIENVSG